MSTFPLLPEGYTYLTEHSEEKLKAWVKELETISYVTWRASKTYPHSGRVNLFQLDMRCQHNTDSRALHTKRSHKNTGCPASLRIVVKRIVKHSRSHNAAQNSDYPTVVTINHHHNHSIDDAAALKFRDMSSETKQTLLDLFNHGHTASSALHCLKADLLLKYGHGYNRVAADGRFVPSVSRVQKLYDSEFKRKHCTMPSPPSVEQSSMPSTDEKTTAQLTVEEQDKLTKFFERLNAGIARNPEVFVPAVRQMLHNIDHYALTESGLLSAITSFGQYSGMPAARRSRFGVRIRVKPNAVSRQKELTGQRRLGPGLLRKDGKGSIPPGLEVIHDNVSFGSLPAHKRKAPHNLQACIYNDTGLNSVKQAKLS